MAANEDGAIIARVCKDHALEETDAKTWFYGDESIGQPVSEQQQQQQQRQRQLQLRISRLHLF